MPTPPVVADPIFFLDYDGTLAPIVDDPLKAYPHPDVPEILRNLSARYPLWIVTGRYMQNLERFLSESYPAIGLHGMQEGVIGGEVRDLVDDDARHALEQMRSSIPDVEGLYIEPKGPTFAVHYRNVSDEDRALRSLDSWVDTMPAELEVVRGKKVYEVRPRGINKGVAVLKLLSAVDGGTPVYLGDDVTDEDAFAALEKFDASVTVRVGGGKSRARYRLDDPDAVAAYLIQYV